MAIAWYGVKVWRMISPIDGHVELGTKPMTAWTYETWARKDETGAAQGNVIRNAKPKYLGVEWDMAYNLTYDAANPTVYPTAALMRVVYPDGGSPPLAAGDFDVLLDTQAKWNAVMNLYPTLKYCFADQPYFPKV